MSPLVLLGMWGYAYLSDCFAALSAPGVPVELNLKVPSGELRFRADSYDVNLGAGLVRLTRPKLFDPQGLLLASADSVRVDGLNALWGSDQVLNVTASDVYGRLVRLKSGKFQIQDLLPAPKANPTKIPFNVEVHRGIVDVIDEEGDKPYQLTARADTVRVAGLGNDWTSSATLSIDNVGKAQAVVQKSTDVGILLSIDTPSVELASLARHLATTRDAERLGAGRQVRATSILASGSARVLINPRGQATIDAHPTVTARNVQYGRYQADQATFGGHVSSEGAEGTVTVSAYRSLASFKGACKWVRGFLAGGQVEASAQSTADLPPDLQKLVPRPLTARGIGFHGWCELPSVRQAHISGQMNVTSLTYQDISGSSLQAQIDSDLSTTSATLDAGMVEGQALRGTVRFVKQDRSISGGIDAPSIDMKAIASRFHVKYLSGTAALTASLSGTIDSPRVQFAASGKGTYAPIDGRQLLSQFALSGQSDGKSVTLLRSDISGPAGQVYATGELSADRSLRFTVVGRQIRTGLFQDLAQGPANIEAHVGGTLDAPFATGRVEAYAIQTKGHEIPLITADFSADEHSLRMVHGRAIQGATQAEAEGVIDLDHKYVTASGRVTGVQVADYLNGDNAGTIDVPHIDVEGPLKSPTVTAQMSGEALVIGSTKVDQLDATAHLVGNSLTLSGAKAELAGGEVSADGAYDLRTKVANLSATMTPLNLADLTNNYSTSVALAGTVAGAAKVELRDNKLVSAKASGTLQKVLVNGTLLGDGPWTLEGSGKSFVASLDVGQLDRFITIDDAKIDLAGEKPKLALEADLFNIGLDNIVDTALRYLPDISYDTLTTLRSARGLVNASISATGAFPDLSVDINSLDATKLTLRGEEFGALHASVRREGQTWNIDSLTLKGGIGNAAISGEVQEKGDLRLDGEINDVDLSQLGGFAPGLAGLTGKVTKFSFLAKGKTESPVINSSLSGAGLFASRIGPSSVRSLNFELPNVTISESVVHPDKTVTGGIEIGGTYSFGGFEGDVDATLPFKYPFAIPDDGKLTATVRVANQNLNEIAAAVSSIDPKRSDGSVAGDIVVSGTPSDLRVAGGIKLAAKKLAFIVEDSPVDDTLQDLTAELKLVGDGLGLDIKAGSSRGGSFHLEAKSQPGAVSQAISTLREGGAEALWANSFAGELTVNDLKFKQAFAQKTYIGGTLAGRLDLAGTLRRPSVTGAVTASNIEAVIPPLPAGTDSGSTPYVNPKFDVSMKLGTAAHVGASAADLYLEGGGSLQGTLAQPQLTANLSVDKGQLRLPAALVRLEQGGTVDLSYQSNRGQTLTRLNVDLTGLTQVTAPTSGDTIQRYDVTLGVKGDLLSDNGLVLTANSDPPDLSQERILALLGQTDILQSLNQGSGVSRGEAQRQVQSALAGFALPTLFSPLTTSVAKSLGLDYFDLGFNPYQEATVAFAKSLNDEFTFQGSRGLSQPPPGYPFQFDYRLVYHPRRFGGILRRFSLFIGTDQYNPLKFGAIYGTKF